MFNITNINNIFLVLSQRWKIYIVSKKKKIKIKIMNDNNNIFKCNH